MTTPVVLITGALTGIGRATALAFAQKGARIVVSGRRDEAGRALAAELRALGAEAEFVLADVRHEDDVRRLVDETVARFGRLDAAINNAGTEGHPGPIVEQSPRQLRGDLRHECARHHSKHEARIARDAGAGQRQHRQHLLDLWSSWSARCVDLCRQQARGRGIDQIRRAGGCWFRHPGQCGGAGPDRYRDAHPLYRHRRTQDRNGGGRATPAPRNARGDSRGDCLYRVRRRVFYHRPHLVC